MTDAAILAIAVLACSFFAGLLALVEWLCR